jgi:hypothetical protein
MSVETGAGTPASQTVDHICAGLARWMCTIGAGHLVEDGEEPPTPPAPDCPQCEGRGRFRERSHCQLCRGSGLAPELGGQG